MKINDVDLLVLNVFSYDTLTISITAMTTNLRTIMDVIFLGSKKKG